MWWIWPAKYSMEFQLPTLLVNNCLKEENVKMVDKEKIKSDIKSIAKLTDSLASIDVLSPIHQKVCIQVLGVYYYSYLSYLTLRDVHIFQFVKICFYQTEHHQ